MKHLLFISANLLLSILIVGEIDAQHLKPELNFDSGTEAEVGGKKSPIFNIEMTGVSGIQRSHTPLGFRLHTYVPKHHSSAEVRALKAEKMEEKLNSIIPEREEDPSVVIEPQVKRNFEANWMLNGTPPDDNMAISNGGVIVSTNNDGIAYYTENGQLLYFAFWRDFFNNPILTGSIFDPRVEYDSGSDRFVMTVLHGNQPSNSTVIMCFSKSANPSDGWNTYLLTGNPANAGNWFDYPSLGISNNEVYVTGNLFDSQDQFDQAVIYQIEKETGYSGTNIRWQYWSGLSSQPFPAFSLVPAVYGHSGNYGPGIYLISSRSGGSDQMRFWDLTDDMSGSPELRAFAISTRAYEPAAEAFQQGTTDKLDNGDCRLQDAFYLNGILHYTYTLDIGEGWNGLSYNRLDVRTRENLDARFGLQGTYDYCYPGVISFSTERSDPSVMIGFLRSSSQTYPQVRVVSVDEDFDWSNSVLVKSGENFVNIINGDERWGDYTSMSRKHNAGSSPTVWMSGSYGGDVPQQSRTNTYKTRVAEIGGMVTSTDNPSNNLLDLSVSPNPIFETFTISFDTPFRGVYSINIYDHLGRVVRHLFSDKLKEGHHELIFNKEALLPGTYHVVVENDKKVISYESVVVHQ